jgi:hypothetical protein
MTAHADRGSDFKTQHVLERNHNIAFGLAFLPKQIRMCLGNGTYSSFGPYTISCLARCLAASLYNFRLFPLSVKVNRTTNFKQWATSFGIRRRRLRGTQPRTVTLQGLAPRSLSLLDSLRADELRNRTSPCDLY